MTYEVLGTPQAIDFGATGVEEVLQNVRTLLCTKKYSVPLDRALGIEFSMLDKPLLQAQTDLRVAIIETIRKDEPRAIVKEVTFTGDGMNGVLIPKVVVDVDV